ncbi:MAG: hypothetical protein NVS4B8_11110 [Herpetosiphon sp.]
MNADVLVTATAQARDTLLDLERLLTQIGDADLHRADPGGGWTCAQLVSHIHLCSLLWIADLERIRNYPQQSMFMFREEIGHDALGAPPPSTKDAAARIASVRVALEQCWPKVDPAILSKSVEVPTIGTMTVAEWFPIIVGHVAHHVGQIKAILKSRNVLPAGADGEGQVGGPDV